MNLSPLCMTLLMVTNVSVAATLTFDDLGPGPVDANGAYTQGVHFGFAPGQATYNGVIGTSGTAVLSIDPVLMGPTSGTLNLAFDVPTTLLQFDIIFQSLSTIDDSSMGENGGPAYTVLLSSGATLTGSTTPQPDGMYSEGVFQYSGAPINGASITFFNGFDSGGMLVENFGLDNLTFDATGSLGAPEPPTNLLIAAGLIAVGTLRRYSL
jgi:hypothetical protein